MLKRYQLSNYATAFGFRQARVYTVGCGSAFAGHSGKLRPAEHLPGPTHGAFLKISPFQRDSGNLREKPTVFLAGRRREQLVVLALSHHFGSKILSNPLH